MANLKVSTQKDEAKEFAEKNGIVLRMIFTLWKTRYFTWKDLLSAMEAYSISKDDLLTAMYYLNDKSYIACVDGTNGTEVGIWDAEDIDDLKFRMRGDGYKVAISSIKDVAIDL